MGIHRCAVRLLALRPQKISHQGDLDPAAPGDNVQHFSPTWLQTAWQQDTPLHRVMSTGALSCDWIK